MLKIHRAAVTGLFLVAGCSKGAQPVMLNFIVGDTAAPQQAVRATPKPPFASLDSATRQQFLAYARSLRFDSLPMARDSRLMPGRSPRLVGSVLTTDPEIGSYRLDSAGLDSGRVVARLTASADDGVSVLRAGVTYLWVDRHAGYWRLAFVPVQGAIVWRPGRVATLRSHTQNPQGPYLMMAQAKWKIGNNGTWVICTSCTSQGWCESDSTTR